MRWHICVILIVVIQHCEGGIVKENVQTLGSTTNRATGSTPAASSVITATTKGNVFTPSVINRIQVPSLSKQTDFIFPKVQIDPNADWSWMITYFDSQITRLASFRWPCRAKQVRAIYCMMQNILATNLYIQRSQKYWYPEGKLRDVSERQRRIPGFQNKLTKQQVTISQLRSWGNQFYTLMLPFYYDYPNDLPRQGIQHELCIQYPFPGQKDWTDLQFQWIRNRIDALSKSTGITLRKDQDDKINDSTIKAFRQKLSKTPRTITLTDDIICNINYLGLVISTINEIQANLPEQKSWLWMMQQLYYESQKSQLATHYLKQPSSIPSSIMVKPQDLSKTIQQRLIQAGKDEVIPKILQKFPSLQIQKDDLLRTGQHNVPTK